MKKQIRILTVLLIVVLFAGACSSATGLNKEKFKKVSQAALAVKTSFDSGASYQQFGDLLQNFAVEITALQGKLKTNEETDLLKAYLTLLAVYQDGLQIWKSKLEFAPFDFVPKGRIYVTQDIDSIVIKYRLPTESHLYKPTQKYWKSISEDSLQIIRDNADSQLKIIENITNY